MHSKLLLLAFEKVRKELNDEGVKSPSINQCAIRLSSIISESFAYGDRRLRDFYNEAIGETGGDIEIPQKQVLLALANYLDYKDYRDFENQHFQGSNDVEVIGKTEKETPKNGDGGNRPFRKKINFKIIISISFLIACGFFGYHYFNKQQWMKWDGTRYVESAFDSQTLNEGNLKVYKEERINNFERQFPKCETEFFNDDGSVRVWYGKNKDGKLQYFTSYGLHPETGKTLKPISKYMIRKYICP